VALLDDGNLQRVGKMERRKQTGGSGPDDQDIGRDASAFHY
jgi:hypothetical protein